MSLLLATRSGRRPVGEHRSTKPSHGADGTPPTHYHPQTLCILPTHYTLCTAHTNDTLHTIHTHPTPNKHPAGPPRHGHAWLWREQKVSALRQQLQLSFSNDWIPEY